MKRNHAIGFAHGAPESAETNWEEKLDDGSTVIFTETRQPEGCGFNYRCKRFVGDPDTFTSINQQSTIRLTRDQVRKLPRIADFLKL
jgi:hypothetical protein